MQDKVLSTISEEVLAMTFSYNGKDMLFRDYLVREVLPYIDLSKDTIMLKSGIEISLKQFIEQAVFYICQNKYDGNFVDFAKDNIVAKIDKIEKKKSIEEDKDVLNINSDDKTYVFYEELSGPKYLVIISENDVVLACRDGKNDIIMRDNRNQKDFLTRIKKLDIDLFMDMYNKHEIFSDYVRSFNKDKIFYNSLLAGVRNKSSFDNNYDKELAEMSDLINLVESGDLFTNDVDENADEVKTFDIDYIPLFNTNVCLEIVQKKCRAFYSEFVSDIAAIMEQNSIYEKSEYVIDEYLSKTINHKFYEYVSSIAEAVNNNLEVVLNDYFISYEIDEVINGLKGGLKKLFINPNSSHESVTSEVYIKIIVEAIRNEITKYEAAVNKSIIEKLNAMGIQYQDDMPLRKVS